MVKNGCVINSPTIISCQGFYPGAAVTMDVPSFGVVTLHTTMFEVARNGYGIVVTGLLIDQEGAELKSTLAVKRNGQMSLIT